MQHDVDAVHRARRQRPAVAPAAARQHAVHVVDVDRGQLVDPDLAENWFEMVLDDAAGLRQCGRGPRRRRVSHPPIKQISHCSGTEPGISGILDELTKTGGCMSSRAMDGLGRPPLTPTVAIRTEIDTQFPRVRALSQ